jgi:Mn2+/Fe2+ NRAMP family transporter
LPARFATWGPGLLVMLAATPTGNVVTAAQASARWGYRLLPLVLIPVLYMVQELIVRLPDGVANWSKNSHSRHSVGPR